MLSTLKLIKEMTKLFVSRPMLVYLLKSLGARNVKLHKDTHRFGNEAHLHKFLIFLLTVLLKDNFNTEA